MFEAVTIGDLHFDNKLVQYQQLADINERIGKEVDKVLSYASKNGIKYAIYLGDVCNNPSMSGEAHVILLDLLKKYPDIKHIMITGNHDTECVGKHSLLVLKRLGETGVINNLKIIDSPVRMFANKGFPVNFLPWPHFSICPASLNIIHVETNGAQWDHGKKVENERRTKYTFIGGHLHTKQELTENHLYPGTLYQTNFGERADKFFAHIKWDGKNLEYELIPNKPSFELRTIIVSSSEDLKKIKDNPNILYRVIVKTGVDLDAGALENYTNVVKTNPFKTKEDLAAILSDDLHLNDADSEVNLMTVMDALGKWMLRAKIEEPRQERAAKLLARLLDKTKE
jgi:DNA repair exonuclease SbcCD nuclease subunit